MLVSTTIVLAGRAGPDPREGDFVLKNYVFD